MRIFFKACLVLGLMLTSLAAASAVAAQDGCDITGTSDGDELDGGHGNQVICGRGGGDSIHGGSGKDDLSGNAGRDALYGDSGTDTLTGGNGADFFSGGTGYDVATDFECGVDEHDGTVEEGIDCGGGNLPDECYGDSANGHDVTCSFETAVEGFAFLDDHCVDEGSPFPCTIGDTSYLCSLGDPYFVHCDAIM